MKERENEGRGGIAQEKTDAPVSAHDFIAVCLGKDESEVLYG